MNMRCLLLKKLKKCMRDLSKTGRIVKMKLKKKTKNRKQFIKKKIKGSKSRKPRRLKMN